MVETVFYHILKEKKMKKKKNAVDEMIEKFKKSKMKLLGKLFYIRKKVLSRNKNTLFTVGGLDEQETEIVREIDQLEKVISFLRKNRDISKEELKKIKETSPGLKKKKK